MKTGIRTTLFFCLMLAASLAGAQGGNLPGGGGPPGGGGGGAPPAATETAAQTAGKNDAAAGAKAAQVTAVACLAVKAAEEKLQEETGESLKECAIATAIAYPIAVQVSKGTIAPAVGGGVFVAAIKVTQGEFAPGKALSSTAKVLADTAGFAAIVAAGPPGWAAFVLGGVWSWLVEGFFNKTIPQTTPAVTTPGEKDLATKAKLPDG